MEPREAGPGARAGPLEPGVRSMRSGAGSHPLVGEARSWGVTAGPRGSRAGVRQLAGGVIS